MYLVLVCAVCSAVRSPTAPHRVPHHTRQAERPIAFCCLILSLPLPHFLSLSTGILCVFPLVAVFHQFHHFSCACRLLCSDKPHRSTLTEYLVTLAKLKALTRENVRASSPKIELRELPPRSATTVSQVLLSMKRPLDAVDFARTLSAEGFALDVFHYGCVIEALSASGKLNAAEVLVKALESSKDPFAAISR